MTTIAQVHKAMRPLLERHDDLAFVGRHLIVKPVHHILRFICIDRCSDPDRFVPHYVTNLPFLGYDGWSLGSGYMIARPKTLWKVSNPASIELMLDVIESEALPRLRGINSLDDYVADVTADPTSAGYFYAKDSEQLGIAVATGDFDKARSICDKVIARKSWSLLHLPEFYPALLENDRPALAEALHAREARTVQHLKLQNVWERTPFPIEL